MSNKPEYRAEYFEKPITQRVARLREEVVNARPILCSERAVLITEHYKNNESTPQVLKRALALKEILSKMTQNIWDEELIVGSHGGNGRRSAPIYPEFAVEWIEEELDEQLETRSQDMFVVPDQVKADLKGIFPYWFDKTNYKKYRSMLPQVTMEARDSYMFTRDIFERGGYGHTAYDIDKLLRVGVRGLRQEAEEKLKTLDLTVGENLNKKMFYEGILICLDSVSIYCKRYANRALTLMEDIQDNARRQELTKIADVCNWIAEEPARDIYDALQLIFFMQIIIQTETSGDSVSPGRMDQYLYRLYKNDVESGKYSIAFIQELLDCFWLKLNEIVKVQDSESIRIHPGFPLTPNVTIGGQTGDGEDATNELSYLMLNSQYHIRLTNPQFTARIHNDTTNIFKRRIADVLELGTGMPALFGDEGCIEAIRNRVPDMPMERVRDYSIVGCVELAPRGFQGRVNGGFLNVARVIDLALNNGIDRFTREQIGPKTGGTDELKSFDDVLMAVDAQMNYFVKHQVINAAVVDIIQRENTPHLLLSSMVEGCLESGKDLTWGGSLWGATPILHIGEATAANSLTAVKRCVFDEGLFTLGQLKKALDSDFETEEGKGIQNHLLASPKYGNDDDYADEVMCSMTNIFFDAIDKHKDIDGRPYTSMILTLGATVPHGWKTAATADGRKSGAPVSDSMSPSNLGDSEGPTAVLHSAAKIDQNRIMQGNVLNLKFNKGAIKSDSSKEKLMSLVSTYFDDMKGQEVQVNVLDSTELRKAQENPEEFKNLIVRIAGYSARFVELAKELQDDIIAREEHASI